LKLTLPDLIKESKEVQFVSFTEVIEKATNLFRKKKGKTGPLTFSEGLVQIHPSGEALVIGDLHGDLESLITILTRSSFFQKMSKSHNSIMVFLGDYGDRGKFSVEVYYLILKLKLCFPEQVVLLRGNHEGPENLIPYPHDLPTQFKTKFKNNWQSVYRKIRELFNLLPNAAFVEERYLMIHGGLPPRLERLEDLMRANTDDELLENLLWNDPNADIKDFGPSPRGAGNLFGKKITSNVLKKLSLEVLIRSHECCEEGFKIGHGGKVLTLFSRKGPPYFNEYGAYLHLPLSEMFDNAKLLLPYIHKF